MEFLGVEILLHFKFRGRDFSDATPDMVDVRVKIQNHDAASGILAVPDMDLVAWLNDGKNIGGLSAPDPALFVHEQEHGRGRTVL